MNRHERRAEKAQKKQDPSAYRHACHILQRQHGLTLEGALAVVRAMDRESTQPLTELESNAAMIFAAARMGGLISEELAEEIIGKKAIH